MLDQPVKKFINTKSREILGIEYSRTIKDMLLESAESLMHSGSIPMQRRKAKK